jgi:tetratricopeptide (TPR) repeat protein
MAISLETRAPEIYLHRAACLWLLNREHDAIADCNTAQLLNALLPRSYILRAHSYLSLGNLQQTELELQKAEALDPDDPSLFICRARLLLAQTRADEALEIVDRFVQLHPTMHASFLVVRAVICKALTRYEESERYLDDALRINPKNLEALWHHGDTFEKIGKVEQGRAEKSNAIDFGYTPKP